MTRHQSAPMSVITLRYLLLAGALCATLPIFASAQEVHVLTRVPGERVVFSSNSDRPMLGITTASESVRADTLGLVIEDVQSGSPAEKAGLKEGDRLQAINGVSLRADRADAGENEYDGVLSRRLVREMTKVKEGDEVELRVVTDGRVRTVKVKPVPMSELYASTSPMGMMRRVSNRAVLGLTIGSTGSARDTIGVFVSAVTSDGPAEKAGSVEGDRIAAINGVSVRVSREDAEDDAVGGAKAERLRREIGELTAGDTVQLSVVSAGRTRTVRVVSVKASDLQGSDGIGTFERRGVSPLMREEIERTMTTRPRVRMGTPDGATWESSTVAPTPPTPPAAPAAPMAPMARTIRGRIITI